MKTFNKKILGGAVSLLMAAAPGLANAAFSTFQDFTVNEGSVPGAFANTFTADKMNGGYTEILTIGAPDVNGIAHFDTLAFATFNAFYANQGGDLVQTQAGTGFLAPNQYLINSVFSASGTINLATQVFTGTSAALQLFMDPNSNTSMSFGATALSAYTLNNAGDDYLLGSAANATLLSGTQAGATPGTGNFDFIFNDFVLSSFGAAPDGEKYFIAPRPFYLGVNPNGDFDNGGVPFGPGTLRVTGDISAVFENVVPEPNSLALLGLGFLGLSSFARRGKV